MYTKRLRISAIQRNRKAVIQLSPNETQGEASYFYAKIWSVDQTLNSRFVADGYTPKIT